MAQVESLPSTIAAPAKGGGALLGWREMIETSEHTHMVSEDGLPILVGDGPYYLGGWPDDALWDRVVVHLAARQGLALVALPGGVRIRDTTTHRFAFNYGTEPQVLSGKTIPPAGVAWWELGSEKSGDDPTQVV